MRVLANDYNVPKYFFALDYVLDIYYSVIHSRLRLGACGLNNISLHLFVAVFFIVRLISFAMS